MYQYESEAIIYLASSYDDPFNPAIAENHRYITDRFKEIGIHFEYLPKIISDEKFSRILDYHHPYLSNYKQTDSGELEFQLKKHLNIATNKPVFIYLSEKSEDIYNFELTALSNELTQEQLSGIVDEALRYFIPIKIGIEIDFKKQEDSRPMFSMGDDTFSGLFCEEEEKAYYSKDADTNFNTEAFKIPGDLREKINELKEAGYLSKLIEFLEELQKTTRKLSRLRITQDYKIYLMDYEMKEVKMSPLPKALYLLFLKHPEGILFKELTDFRTELMDIYKNITLRESPDKARLSILKITDPFDNSVNEKCSLIRIAFLKVVSEEIAENYYITGRRGEPKNITLDRELVINEHTSRLQGL